MATETGHAAPYVFLSYASADRERALHVADLLDGQGIAVWLDRKSIAGGASWSAEIVRGIEGCTTVAVLCSPASMASPNVQQEIQLAWDARRPILPLLLEAVHPPEVIRYAFAGRQWIEVLDRPDDVWLVPTVRALAGLGVSAAPRPASPAVSEPDPGPSSPRRLPPPRLLTNLPIQLTSLIGRESEVASVTALLRTPGRRLVTLIGPGGIGKTRLALQVGADLLDDFPDGVFFVDLAPVADPALVVSTIAQTLSLREESGHPLCDTVRDALRAKCLLLVLDNFEQVVDAAPLATVLLTSCPHLSILATSRTLLQVQGEQAYDVPPLALPVLGSSLPPERLSQYAAVRLFVDRAVAARSDFAVTTANAPAVAAICTRLDGLPLAIELAAARVRLLPPQVLLPRLSERLHFLTGGARDLPARQRTLRSTIAWSHDLLAADEKVLFSRLAVFAGSFSLQAVEAIATPGIDLDPLAGLDRLVAQSLLRPAEIADQPRFQMLETIREFARECLVEGGESDAIRQRHAEHYLTSAEEIAPKLRGPEQRQWLEWLEIEQDNVRAALSWLIAENQADGALRFGLALLVFWTLRGYHSEGRRWLEACAALPRADQFPTLRNAARGSAGMIAVLQGNYQEAILLGSEALASVETMVDLLGQWATVAGLGTAAMERGDLKGARVLFEQGMDLCRRRGFRWGVATFRGFLGHVALRQGQYAQADRYASDSIADFQQLGDRILRAYFTGIAAMIANRMGDLDKARDLHEEALTIQKEDGDRANLARTFNHLGRILLEQGDVKMARRRLVEGLLVSREIGLKGQIAQALEGLSALAVREGAMERAVTLLGVVSALRTAAHVAPSTRWQAEVENVRRLARDRVGDQSERWWARGETMSLEEAIAYALEAGAGILASS